MLDNRYIKTINGMLTKTSNEKIRCTNQDAAESSLGGIQCTRYV